MDLESRLSLIRQVGEEIITEDDLRALLETKKRPIAYDGFEPSGTSIHIAQGLLRSINVNKMTKAGATFKIWVADWHAWANNKLGGDLQKIQKAGKYMVEVWKASGMDTDKVKFLWASDVVSDEDYWSKVMKIAINTTLKRALRCSQIMGRSESDALQASQILYPCMQAADIFHLEADIAQLGMDQRKVNILARELAPKLGFKKPVAVHHHMLMGLTQPLATQPALSAGASAGEDAGNEGAENKIDRTIALKMSKSNPNSAIFMTDSKEEVERKLQKAYCPEQIVEDNPVLEYCRYIIFEKVRDFEVERPQKFGGNVSFASYAELQRAFTAGNLHPMDLKRATADCLNKLLDPVRKKLANSKATQKLAEEVNQFEITR